MTNKENKIEKLIAELCPDGVEFLELSAVLDYEQPTPYIVSSAKYDDDFVTPVLTAGKSFILGYTNEEEGIYKANKNDSVIIFDDFTTSFHWVDFDFKIKSSAMKMIKPKTGIEIDFRFIYFAMRCIHFQKQDHSRHWISKYSKLKIPIPPLKIQQEIVAILDNFTQLTAELEAELEARKKQYEYYRNELLTFEERERLEWLLLSEVTMNTKNIKWKDTNDSYQYIDLSSVDRDTHFITTTVEISSENAPSRAQKIVQKDDIIFATTRPTLQRYVIIGDDYDGQIASTGYCVLRSKGIVLPKWIYYNIAKTEFNDYVESNQKGSAYPAISDAKVKNFKIPVPPISEQKRIVSILDKFDALTNSISEGLPAEISARKKQYEYYRNQLLTFPELTA